jgi:sulfur-carrier protein
VMSVTVEVPAAVAGGTSRARIVVELALPDDAATVADVLDALAETRPAVERRMRDETGHVRRFVNLYVDDTDVRQTGGVRTPVRDGAQILVIPSVAGG